MTAEQATGATRAWLEGYRHAAAKSSGLDWDRWRCAAAADLLRSQPDGGERAVVRAVCRSRGGRDRQRLFQAPLPVRPALPPPAGHAGNRPPSGQNCAENFGSSPPA